MAEEGFFFPSLKKPRQHIFLLFLSTWKFYFLSSCPQSVTIWKPRLYTEVPNLPRHPAGSQTLPSVLYNLCHWELKSRPKESANLSLDYCILVNSYLWVTPLYSCEFIHALKRRLRNYTTRHTGVKGRKGRGWRRESEPDCSELLFLHSEVTSKLLELIWPPLLRLNSLQN